MSKQSVWLPRRVQAGVISETLGDGTAVVVQLDSQQAHSLDALAARVWELADGTRSVTAVALAADVPAERVEATLAQLDGLGLLEDDAVGGHSRRSVLARAAQLGGGLVVAGGVINSMALPAAAKAVSSVLQSVAVTYSTSNSTFSYQDGMTMTMGTISADSTIYLTDTGVSTSTTAPAKPYVSIEAVGAGVAYMTFYSVTGATASYGFGSDDSSATTGLSNMSPVVPMMMVGTGTSTLWVTIGT